VQISGSEPRPERTPPPRAAAKLELFSEANEAMRGRKPKPSVLKAIQGNPGKRAIAGGEPQPLPGIPSCPPHLHADAREEWDRITAELAKLGLLCQVDRAALAAYCGAYGTWISAAKLCQSVVYQSKTGLIKVNPAVRVQHDAMILMHKFLSEFGLSPASRSRIQLGEQTPQDEFDEFLRSAG
jgi:P27 family predicted phage terminase small subunit